MAWTAADIYKISKGTNQKQNQWTANDVQKAAQGTNVSRAKKEQDNLYAIALDSYVNKNQNVEAKYGAPLKTFSLPQTSSLPSTAAKSNNVLEQVGSGAAEYGSGAAQKLKASYAPYSQKEEFDRLNEWFDQPRNQELVNKLLEKKSSYTTYAEQGTSKNAASAGDGSIDPFRTAAEKNQSGAKYTDDDLKKQGYSAEEIAQAKDYLTRYDAIPEWKKQTRRLGNLIGGIADSVAGGTVMTGELGAQSAKNIAETQKNWAKVQQEIKGDERAEKLFQLLTDVDMDYNPAYPVSKNWELALMGYGSEAIRNMRDRLAGLEVNDSIDPEQSVGYQLYRRGQDLTGAAQSGLSDGTRAVQSAVTSAAENLAVSAINPAAVLPVLSLQGASDAMGQSIEKGESAGKALAGGALKFGAGWAINSVGMADLAKTMGSDYAKDTMAGQIADFVRGMAGKSDFAQKYPAVANAISGGVDNALQAFAETYADTAIDAALGDPDAAKELFSKEHLLSAMESGLSGGASGALGGAVGTGLAKINDGDASLKGWADYYDDLDQIEKAAAAAKKTQQRTQEPGMQSQTVQEGAAEKAAVTEQTAVNDDPAVHTAAQNASIEEYKNSVDPKLAEYVDKVRSGEKLAPYVVSKTSDRMRSAMMELTGLNKVGDYTLLDNNGVKHITNRHAGGDGSADATMKESADVARAAYVLNNFDNAYLGTRKADGYVTKNGKRAPIVIFEKKIDGSHIIVEAVTDTSKNRNFIVSEYLSSIGVPEKEIARTLYSSMDAVADPRDTSETLDTAIPAMTDPTETADDRTSGNRSMEADETSRRTDAESVASGGRGQPGNSKTSIAPERASVNGQDVEKAGETVETSQSAGADSSPNEGSHWQDGTTVLDEQRPTAQKRADTGTEARDYADAELKADPAALDESSWERSEQKRTAQELVARGGVSTKATQGIVDAMPDGVGAAVYAQAAKSMYRMGVTQDVSFERALELTGSGGMGGAVRQVLALGKRGENALKLAYLYGSGEAETYNAAKASEIGRGTGVLTKDAGTYSVNGQLRTGATAEDAFIELGAKSSGTAVKRMMEGLKNGAKGFIQTAAGKMYLSGEAGSETMMHETFHALNEWSPETGQAVMDRLLKYLVEANGMESTEKLVQNYLDRYAANGQKVTYNQALEEVTADAMETVFGTADGFRDFVRQQAAEAKMNAQARGAIGKVMDKIETLLQKVLADVERFLKQEPTNAAAKAAKSLTEEQLKDLRELYFEHQAAAGERYRDAIAEQKNGTGETKTAASSKTEETAVKYSINPDYAQEIEDWNNEGRPDGERFILGRTGDTLQKLGAHENDIYMNSSKINLILKQHPEMTLDEIKRIPEILEEPVMVLTSQNKGRAKQNTRLVMFGNVKAQDGRPVMCVLDLRPVENHIVLNDMQKVTSSYTKDANPEQFVRNSNVLFVSENKNETTAFLRTLGFKIPSELQHYGLIGSIAYEAQEIKLEGIPFTELETTNQKRTAAWLGSNGLQLPVPPTMYGSMGKLTYFEGSVKMMEPNSRNAKLAEFLTRDADGKYQLDVDADAVDAAKETGLGDVAAQTETVRKAVEAGGNKRVSDESLTAIARAVKSDIKSRMSAADVTERLKALSEYLSGAKEVSWEDANGFMMDLAEQLMYKSAKKNDELWKAYPELHEMGMKVEKGSTAFQELVYRYGSWANAKRELGRHGVKITQLPEGQHSRWDADFRELQEIGKGYFPDEVPNSAADALEAMANAHDAIKPVLENAFEEDWDGAKQDIAMQLWQRYLASPELANEANKGLREEFESKRQEVRDIARRQAAEARAKAAMAAAQREQEAKDAMLESYRRETAKAIERRDKAEEFARKQRASVEARVQLEKSKREEQVKKLRDARENDNTRRVVRKLTRELTQMTEKPTEKSYAPEYLLDKLRPVVALANDAIGDHEAARKVMEHTDGVYGPVQNYKQLEERVDGLSRGIEREMNTEERAAMEWQQSKLPEKIADWLADVNENRQIEMEKLRGEIENANKWLTKETPEKKAYLDRLNADLKVYQDGGMAALNTEQLRGLREILEQTMYIVKNETVLLGSMEDVMVDEFAETVNTELKSIAAEQKKGIAHTVLRELSSTYRLNTMNIERNFERLGGYNHGGAMEQLGRMLNDGQARKERITAEGEAIFADVTGPKHEEELYHFTHDLVDIGLKTEDGKPWLVTHDVMTELWVQLQNPQGMHHLLYGGATIADMSFSTKGLHGLGEQFSETVKLGELATTDENGNKLNAYEISQREDTLRTSLIGEIEKNLTAYDDQWIAAFRKLGALTKRYVNETSMALYGVKLARVNNYIRLHVDRNTRVEQNTGIKNDKSVGSEGFLKSRQASSKPLELVGLVRQASESIENTAQFAGMGIPLRNAEKVLNSMQEGKTLYGQIERVWGRAGRSYMTKAMADLTGSKGESEVFDRLSGALRGAAARAVLTGNLNVTLLQAASLPTAAAELGGESTLKSMTQFAKNLSPSKLKEMEARAYRFGDAMLTTRLRGSQRGELNSAAKETGVLGTMHETARNSQNAVLRNGVRAVDAVGDFAGGSIGKMDEITVTALFYGSEHYVQQHMEEFELTKADLPTKEQADGSEAYQKAVKEKFQRVVERTQPNYTTMQRTGMQRSKNQALKFLTMFSTQRQQNAQIMVSAAEDMAAQWSRNNAAQTAYEKAQNGGTKAAIDEAKANLEKTQSELDKAEKRMASAVFSQIVQTAVIAGLGTGVKFFLHKWGDLQDENGDMTFFSLAGNFLYQFFNSAVSNYTGGSEVWTAAETILTGKTFGTYDSISMTGLSAINDAVKSITKLNGILDKDTSEMTEEQFDAYESSVRWAWADAAGQLSMLVGVPYNNQKKYVQAVFSWMDTIKQWDETGEKSFSSLPSSATGQYDRLFNAIQSGDSDEAKAALKKLDQMGKTDQVESQLKSRLKKYDDDILAAAEAQNAGKDKAAFDAKKKVFERLRTAYGVKGSKERGATQEDQAKRNDFINLVNAAVDEKAETLLKGGTSGSVYDQMKEALDGGRAKDVNDEIKRLLTSGKSADAIKSAITGQVKDEYLAGSSADRKKLETMLLKLRAEGKALYEEKNFETWLKDAEKQKATAKKDEWKDVR